MKGLGYVINLDFPPKVWEPTVEFSAAWARFVRLLSIIVRGSGSRRLGLNPAVGKLLNLGCLIFKIGKK